MEHVRKVDQRAEFLRDVRCNSPAPLVASGPSSRRSSNASRRSKRSGLILVATNDSPWRVDVEELNSAGTASSLPSSFERRGSTSRSARKDSTFSQRKRSVASTEGAASRKKSLQSAGSRKSSLSKHDGSSVRKGSLRSCWWDDETDSEDDETAFIPVMARRQSRTALTPSKRPFVENKNLFDPSFSFSRRCVTSPDKTVDPLDGWFPGLV